MNAMKSRFRKCCTRSHAGKTVGDGPCGRRDTRIVHEEFLDRRQFPQRLSDGHADDGKHKTDRQDPQHVDPMLADPDLGYYASCGGNQSFRRTRSSAGLSLPSMGSCERETSRAITKMPSKAEPS